MVAGVLIRKNRFIIER